MGHRFESCNAHHFHSVPGRNAGDVAIAHYCTPKLLEPQVCIEMSIPEVRVSPWVPFGGLMGISRPARAGQAALAGSDLRLLQWLDLLRVQSFAAAILAAEFLPTERLFACLCELQSQ